MNGISPRHRVALVLFVVLLAWSACWHAVLDRNPGTGLGQALVLALAPALLPGLMSFISLRGALLGAGFAALLMFCHGVVTAWTTPTWLAWPAILLSAATVVALGGRQAPANQPRQQ